MIISPIPQTQCFVVVVGNGVVELDGDDVVVVAIAESGSMIIFDYLKISKGETTITSSYSANKLTSCL